LVPVIVPVVTCALLKKGIARMAIIKGKIFLKSIYFGFNGAKKVNYWQTDANLLLTNKGGSLN
jgi:hypothetical protein